MIESHRLPVLVQRLGTRERLPNRLGREGGIVLNFVYGLLAYNNLGFILFGEDLF